MCGSVRASVFRGGERWVDGPTFQPPQGSCCPPTLLSWLVLSSLSLPRHMEEDIPGEESTSPSPTNSISVDLTQLSEPEAWWRDHQQWLAEHGYMLRPRYRPGWQPSWITDPRKPKYECEDMDPPIVRNNICSVPCPANICRSHVQSGFILDAVRISDNSLVVLKKVISWRNPHEVDISQYLSSDALRSDPRNHSVHILDVLVVPGDPDLTIMVLPLLRACDNPRWQTEGEVLSFVKQIFEVAHSHHPSPSTNPMFDRGFNICTSYMWHTGMSSWFCFLDTNSINQRLHSTQHHVRSSSDVPQHVPPSAAE